MFTIYILCTILVNAEYYTCSSAGNACKVGTTCCKRSDGKYGCCPLENGICCKDGEGHCCPYGFPVCDIPHKRCTDHLSKYLGSPIKIEPLDIEDSFNFIHGLGSGIGITFDQHISCIENLSILTTLVLKTFDFINEDIGYDEGIYEILEDGIKHFNQCKLDCMGIFVEGLRFLLKVFEAKDLKSVLWEVYEKFISGGIDFVYEYEEILREKWHGRGYRLGKVLEEMFRFS
ncbi:hypothetical protein SteCoe_6531 [Stentor coeruleus]|uniref:Granulins domain-containing protein n=1 Tax=Stentor coeruleus TaxID=5963 RepID=A0A1R2CPM7_9CILI|nr:hypothetical protein SteCoe_6531 [Stentor coeruleus]